MKNGIAESAAQIESISERLQYSTIKITVMYNDGKSGEGTGFFFKSGLGTKYDLLVTNTHLIKDSYEGEFKIHVGISENSHILRSGFSTNLRFQNFADLWAFDDNVDLCYLPVGYILGKQITPYYIPLSEKYILSDLELEKFSAVEEILMVGYPNGLWDEINNLPLIRKGITSIHPSVNFNGLNQGVVDVTTLPGSSGSPILIVNEGLYFQKPNAVVAGNRIAFLGVLFEAPFYYTTSDSIVRGEMPVKQEESFSGRIPINIGYYIKSKEILRFLELYRSTIQLY